MSGRGRSSAGEVLQRLLLVLPLAAREEGAAVEALAGDLGVEARQILRDLEEVEARSYDRPPGLGDQIRLTATRQRLQVWTTGEYRRPVRLSPREALALELALRAAVARDPEAAPFEELRDRLVARLRSPAAEDAEDPEVALAGAEAPPDPVRQGVERALHGRVELRIVYRPPGREPASRRVGPLLLAHAEGRWYLLARDLERDGPRAFRLDRMGEATAANAPFTPSPEDEAAAERFLQDGRVHDEGTGGAGDPTNAVVRYSPRIARWIREQGWEEIETTEDGGLQVRHRVWDPEWLVRHVLAYGPEAEVLEPGWMRERVLEAVAGLVERETKA